MIQLALLDAIQVQPGAALMLNAPDPPAAVNTCPPELIDVTHPAAAAWLTTTGTPAIRIDALRASPALGATDKVTFAAPVPEAAPETVIQNGKAEMDHVQEAAI